MARVRLYLTSKINKLDDISCITPADQNPAGFHSKPEAKECGSDEGQIKSLSMSELHERRKLIAEQDAAYEESLLADRAKRQKLMEEVKTIIFMLFFHWELYGGVMVSGLDYRSCGLDWSLGQVFFF